MNIVPDRLKWIISITGCLLAIAGTCPLCGLSTIALDRPYNAEDRYAGAVFIVTGLIMILIGAAMAVLPWVLVLFKPRIVHVEQKEPQPETTAPAPEAAPAVIVTPAPAPPAAVETHPQAGHPAPEATPAIIVPPTGAAPPSGLPRPEATPPIITPEPEVPAKKEGQAEAPLPKQDKPVKSNGDETDKPEIRLI